MEAGIPGDRHYGLLRPASVQGLQKGWDYQRFARNGWA
jgi:hypothetical protein